MELEKIYPGADTGKDAILKLERNQKVISEAISENANQINVLSFTVLDLASYFTNGWTGTGEILYNKDIAIVDITVSKASDTGSYDIICAGFDTSILGDYQISNLLTSYGIFRIVGASHTGEAFIDTSTVCVPANTSITIQTTIRRKLNG